MNFTDPYYQDQVNAQRRAAIPCCVSGPANEDELQEQCERVLVRAGYHRLTESNLVNFSMSEHAGWFAHWPGKRAIGNPIMPDLVIWDRAMTRTLMVELKASDKAKVRRAQKAAITSRCWKIAYSVDEFAGLLAKWMEA